MQTLYYYRCDGCQEVHEDSSDIFKCSICRTEICVSCCDEDATCYDYCEKPSPLEVIQKFIKDNNYTYKVEDIIEEYKTKWGKSYTSHTMSNCCITLKNELDELIEESAGE